MVNIIKTIWKKCSPVLPDRIYIKLEFKKHMGYFPNLKNPKTFSEKLQWLKLYDRKPIYTAMVDKFEAKKYVADMIGEEYIVPTLGVWDDFNSIDFDSLPDKFVLKCTHDSAGLVIVKDKALLDIKSARKKLEKCLKRNFFYSGREWPYKNVKPRIIAEKYIEPENNNDLYDYKFLCFSGKVKCFKVDYNRFVHHNANYYNREGKPINISQIEAPPDMHSKIAIPENLDKMVDLAETLSKGISFLRVDFYNVKGKIYFGEMTFFPISGFGRYSEEDYDLLLGSWLKLPEIKDGKQK